MEILNEYAFLMNHPQQGFVLMPSESVSYKSLPPTRKEKTLNTLKIVVYVILALIGICFAAFTVWGVIQYPYLIVFLPLGILFGMATSR